MDEPAEDRPAQADVVGTRTRVLGVAALLFMVWWGWTSVVRPPSDTTLTHGSSGFAATSCTVTEPRAAEVWMLEIDVDVQCDYPCEGWTDTYRVSAPWTGTVRVHRSLTGWSASHVPTFGYFDFCVGAYGAP